MIYLALIAFVFCFYIFQSLSEKKDDRIFCLCVVVTLFVMVFRSYDPTLVNYQDDIPNYIKFYRNLPSSIYGTPEDTTFGFEPGLSLVCWMLWLFPKADWFFVLIMRLICMAPIVYGIHHYSAQKELSLLLFILLPGCWLLEMITMRQALATAFLLWGLIFYIKKPRHWKILLAAMAILAALSHSTSYLVLIIAAITAVLPFNKKICYTVLAIAAVSGGLFASRIASLFASSFASFGLFERVLSYISETTEIGGANPLSFVVFAMFGAICVSSVDNVDKRKVFFVKLFVTGIVIYCLLGNYPLVDRMTSFFILSGAIGAMPALPSKGEIYTSLNWWMSMAVCFAFIYLFYSDNCGVDSVFLPYHFLFDRPVLWMYQ